jgi:hypothetical protein
LILSRESIAEAILAFPEASNCINYPLDGPKEPIRLISPATKARDNDYQWFQGCRILETDDLTVTDGFREEVYNAMPLIFILTSGDKPYSVKLLLSHGANKNEKSSDGIPILTFACQLGCTEIVQLLLEYKADINATSPSKRTALIQQSWPGMWKSRLYY